MELKNKVAVITGGGSGIGAATARRFAHAGARVVVVGRTAQKLEETVDAIRARGGAASAIEADISVPADMQRLYETVDEQHGRLDVVFAHAGINGVWAPVDELSPEEWEKTIKINLTGTFLTVRYAVPLLKRRGGAIIITSSVNGTRIFSNAGASAYSSSKAGQIAFMKMIALELAPDKIRVNAICPGAIESEIEDNTERRNTEAAEVPADYPEGRIPLTDGAPGRPEQVADLVLFLASDQASHITGTSVWIDGAESLLLG